MKAADSPPVATIGPAGLAASSERLAQDACRKPRVGRLRLGVEGRQQHRTPEPLVERSAARHDLADRPGSRGAQNRDRREIVRHARSGHAATQHRKSTRAARPELGLSVQRSPVFRSANGNSAVFATSDGARVRRCGSGSRAPPSCPRAAGGCRCRCRDR